MSNLMNQVKAKAPKAVATIEATMSSLEIAALTGKRHSNVMRDIRNMLKELNISEELKTEFSEKINNLGLVTKQPYFKLDKDLTLCLLTGYSAVLRMKVIQRMNQLEKQVETLLNNREASKVEFKPMMKALVTTRMEDGKDTATYHRTNESDMINRIVLGSTAKKYKELNNINENAATRDFLSATQLEAIAELEQMNTSFINCKMEYQQRKAMLQDYFDRRLAKKVNPDTPSIAELTN